MNVVIGLDVGNDTSVIAVAKQRGVDVLLNDESKRETPSVLCFTPSQRLFGSSAEASALTNPHSTVAGLKRRLLSPAIPLRVTLRGVARAFSPVQLLAMLLAHLRALASRAHSAPVADCVIGVPAYLTDADRRAYLDAAAIAGLRPLRLLHEGAAIALGYGIYRADSALGAVVFVDVGHSATQVSVARFHPGKLEMLSHAFDRDLGGADFDEVLFRHFSSQFFDRHGLDVSGNVKACMRLRAACEKAKKVLSANAEAQVSVECLMEEIDMNGLVRREEFEGMCTELLERIVATCKRALEDAGLGAGDVYTVELVGSGSRIPAISRRLMELLLGREPSRTLNSSECIARGCAFQCAMLSPIFRVRSYEVQDSFPFSIGFLTDKDTGSAELDCILQKCQPIPSTKILIFRQNKTFNIEIIYATSDDLPEGADRRICCSKIGPFQLSNDEKAKVKVKVRLDLHGIFHIESASLVEDDIYESSTRSLPDLNSDMDFETSSGDSEGVHVTGNGRTTSTKPLEEHATVDGITMQRRPSLRDLEVMHTMFSGMTKDELAEAQSIEGMLAEEDRKIEEAKDKKNTLEAYVYDIRNKLMDRYRSFANDLEKQDISKSLSQTEEWLYDDGVDESIEVYSLKMNELEKLVNPIERRCKDEEARPQAIKQLFTCIVEFRKVDKKHVPGSVINEVLSECQKAESWLRERGKQQESVPKNADPVLWSEDIMEKTEELRRKCQHILGIESPLPRPETSDMVDRTHRTDNMEED